jgi:hypothetical protein
MNYSDRYAEIFREAADRQARPASLRDRLRGRLPAARPVAVLAACVLAAVAAVLALSDMDAGERAAGPDPEDPRVSALVSDVIVASRPRRETPCRPTRVRTPVVDGPLTPETLAAFEVLRRPAGPLPDRLPLMRSGEVRSEILRDSIRVLHSRGGYVAVLWVTRGPSAIFAARDPEACAELQRAELERRLRGEPDVLARAAREKFEAHVRAGRESLMDTVDRLHLVVMQPGGAGSGTGGVPVSQVRRTGLSGSSIGRPRGGGRVFRIAFGVVPDGVETVEITARGKGWVRRHLVPVRNNYFQLAGFHASSFSIRWLDARGEEIERPR